MPGCCFCKLMCRRACPQGCDMRPWFLNTDETVMEEFKILGKYYGGYTTFVKKIRTNSTEANREAYLRSLRFEVTSRDLDLILGALGRFEASEAEHHLGLLQVGLKAECEALKVKVENFEKQIAEEAKKQQKGPKRHH